MQPFFIISVSMLGVALILTVLWDAYETIILPRHVTRKLQLARLFYRSTWHVWSSIVKLLFSGKRQEAYMGFYGPMSLIILLSVWAGGLICGFALIYWASGSRIAAASGDVGFLTDLYISGTTFFTLGMGDVTPASSLTRTLVVLESGIGLGLFALVISYLPAFNQSFSRREVNISLLDARAGSPPTASELLLRRCHGSGGLDVLLQHLGEWERWAAELLESHMSYPLLAFFRSQHDNQSWLAALSLVLDTSAFVMTAVEGACAVQAQLTFAMARHAIVDLSHILNCLPVKPGEDRLPSKDLAWLRQRLADAGFPMRNGEGVEAELAALRDMYEPYVNALSSYLRLPAPTWIPERESADNWQSDGLW